MTISFSRTLKYAMALLFVILTANLLIAQKLKQHVDNPGQVAPAQHVDNPGQTPMKDGLKLKQHVDNPGQTPMIVSITVHVKSGK